jgi:hypothetical protein
MTRNDAIRIFVEWAKSNSQYLPDPPVELLGRFLVERFPCAAK